MPIASRLQMSAVQPTAVGRLVILACTLALAAALPGAEEVQLSTLDLSLAQQGWGSPGIDRSVEGRPMHIGGIPFAHGFGTHAPCELQVALAGGSSRFTASVGVDDEQGATGRNGSVEFTISGDGKELWRSGVMHGGDPSKPVDVEVSGVRTLILAVGNGGDGNGGDHADWADAKFQVVGNRPETISAPPHVRWRLAEKSSIMWDVAADRTPEHDDFLEQGGRLAGQVVEYAVSGERGLRIARSLVWPSLRIPPNNTHSSLIHHYGREAEPAISVDGAPLGELRVTRVVLDGTLTFHATAQAGLVITRCTFPTTSARTALDRWTLRNTGTAPVTVAVAPLALRDEVRGPYGLNIMEVVHDAPTSTVLAPGRSLDFAVRFSAHLDGEATGAVPDAAVEEAARRAFFAGLQQALRLETPDPVLDHTFAMAKLRVAEAINATRGGLMLAPGGLAYYAATWCNDNVEYAGPFFPFLGDDGGNQASLDTYRGYRAYMKPDYHRIPSSIVAEGTSFWDGAGDRGDAAMYAYGCARFCLARGDRTLAEELWPGIVWCLEYCRRQTGPDGAIRSDHDELEGRFPAGAANLSTISLCYGGLRSAADLARALGRTAEAADYDQRAVGVAQAIERCFGASVEGFATYRYFDGCEVLRSWICLPLCMGLMERRDATIAALFSPRLWTADGLATQAGNRIFWDRSTLYGLRGVFQAGATATALRYLTAFSQRRLLGDHVPYAVETGTHGNQLSSESALYCRVFSEGLFGILPTGLDRFRCTPRLPDGWPRMALRSIRAFGREWDLVVERQGGNLAVTATVAGQPADTRVIAPGASADLLLP
ncbi:MAG: NPCBM/NEW2 domain-containing protein [Planctomycetes bacterium]|nr:NPCBM/NEW2 domain-containing protein [Planctomycetota bacterium]